MQSSKKHILNSWLSASYPSIQPSICPSFFNVSPEWRQQTMQSNPVASFKCHPDWYVPYSSSRSSPGLLPAVCAQNASTGRSSGGILIRCLWNSELLTLPSPDTLPRKHFDCVHLQFFLPLKCIYYIYKWGLDCKDFVVNWGVYLQAQLPLRHHITYNNCGSCPNLPADRQRGRTNNFSQQEQAISLVSMSPCNLKFWPSTWPGNTHLQTISVHQSTDKNTNKCGHSYYLCNTEIIKYEMHLHAEQGSQDREILKVWLPSWYQTGAKPSLPLSSDGFDSWIPFSMASAKSLHTQVFATCLLCQDFPNSLLSTWWLPLQVSPWKALTTFWAQLGAAVLLKGEKCYVLQLYAYFSL